MRYKKNFRSKKMSSLHHFVISILFDLFFLYSHFLEKTKVQSEEITSFITEVGFKMYSSLAITMVVELLYMLECSEDTNKAWFFIFYVC